MFEMSTKICPICKIEKNIEDFHKNKNSKDGYKSTCKLCRKNETKINYEKNKKRYNNQSLNWNKNNPEKRKIIIKKHKQKPLIKFKDNIRHRIYMFLKSKKMNKNNKTFDIVGIKPDELRLYIENKFTKGMTWDNYGKWHIDHIIPLDYGETIDEIYKLCYYTNLQPLWGEDNLKKGKKLD